MHLTFEILGVLKTKMQQKIKKKLASDINLGEKVVDIKKRRDIENKRILEKLKTGESLSLISLQATFFPPRPTIKKDVKLVFPLKKEE